MGRILCASLGGWPLGHGEQGRGQRDTCSCPVGGLLRLQGQTTHMRGWHRTCQQRHRESAQGRGMLLCILFPSSPGLHKMCVGSMRLYHMCNTKGERFMQCAACSVLAACAHWSPPAQVSGAILNRVWANSALRPPLLHRRIQAKLSWFR